VNQNELGCHETSQVDSPTCLREYRCCGACCRDRSAVSWIARWQLVTILERQINGPVEVDRVGFEHPATMNGSVRFRGLRAQAIPGLSKGLAGHVSGQATVQGRDIRSLRELSGTYHFLPSDSPALQLPILNTHDLRAKFRHSDHQFSFTKASRASRSRRGSAHALLTALVTSFSTAW